jgi:hypothetical protein
MKVVVAQFKALSWHLLGETEENHKKPQSGQLVSGPRFETPEYKAGVLTTHCSIWSMPVLLLLSSNNEFFSLPCGKRISRDCVFSSDFARSCPSSHSHTS